MSINYFEAFAHRCSGNDWLQSSCFPPISWVKITQEFINQGDLEASHRGLQVLLNGEMDLESSGIKGLLDMILTFHQKEKLQPIKRQDIEVNLGEDCKKVMEIILSSETVEDIETIIHCYAHLSEELREEYLEKVIQKYATRSPMTAYTLWCQLHNKKSSLLEEIVEVSINQFLNEGKFQGAKEQLSFFSKNVEKYELNKAKSQDFFEKIFGNVFEEAVEKRKFVFLIKEFIPLLDEMELQSFFSEFKKKLTDKVNEALPEIENLIKEEFENDFKEKKFPKALEHIECQFNNELRIKHLLIVMEYISNENNDFKNFPFEKFVMLSIEYDCLLKDFLPLASNLVEKKLWREALVVLSVIKEDKDILLQKIIKDCPSYLGYTLIEAATRLSNKEERQASLLNLVNIFLKEEKTPFHFALDAVTSLEDGESKKNKIYKLIEVAKEKKENNWWFLAIQQLTNEKILEAPTRDDYLWEFIITAPNEESQLISKAGCLLLGIPFEYPYSIQEMYNLLMEKFPDYKKEIQQVLTQRKKLENVNLMNSSQFVHLPLIA